MHLSSPPPHVTALPGYGAQTLRVTRPSWCYSTPKRCDLCRDYPFPFLPSPSAYDSPRFMECRFPPTRPWQLAVWIRRFGCGTRPSGLRYTHLKATQRRFLTFTGAPTIRMYWHPHPKTGRFVPQPSRFSTVHIYLFATPQIILWDVRSPESVRCLVGHDEGVISCSFHPTRQLLASCSNDATIKLWDLDSDKLIHTLSGHTAEVESCVFAQDGNHIASSSMDGSIRIWTVPNQGYVAEEETILEDVHGGASVWNCAFVK